MNPNSVLTKRLRQEAFEEAMGTRSTETRPLWAVAAEEWNPKKQRWDLEIRYNHAENEHLARFTYMASRKLPFRIISVGLVIGYHVRDTKGDKLSV